MLQLQYGLTQVEAGTKFGEIFCISGITLILVGIFNDRFGHIGMTQVFAALCSLLANLWWSFCPTHDFDCTYASTNLPIVLMGVAYGLAAGTTWNSLIYLVYGKKIGSLIGMTDLIASLGLFLTPIVMGTMIDFFSDYHQICLLSLTLASLSFIVSLAIQVLDSRSTQLLQMTVKERNDFFQQIN
jgi:nitrate/nitrite transporter NarK